MMRVAMAIPLAISNEVFIAASMLGLPVSTPSLGNPDQPGPHDYDEPLFCSVSAGFPDRRARHRTVSFYIIGNAFADAADPETMYFKDGACRILILSVLGCPK